MADSLFAARCYLSMYAGRRTIGALVAAEKVHESSLWQTAWIKADFKARRKK